MKKLSAVLTSFFIILSGCVHFDSEGESDWDKRVSTKLCENLTEWASTGPRVLASERKLYLPDAYANANSRYDEGEDVITLTAFAWDYKCPEDVQCEDQADISFKDALRPYAHSLSSSGYFDQLEPCLIGGSVSQDWDRHDKDIYVTGTVADTNVSMKWLSETRETQISVKYK